MGGWEEAA
jgi:hypothetical protein